MDTFYVSAQDFQAQIDRIGGDINDLTDLWSDYTDDAADWLETFLYQTLTDTSTGNYDDYATVFGEKLVDIYDYDGF